jgi:peptide/nickel transport system substrate-binding protein
MLLAVPAEAQKAKDTLRIAANDQFAVLSPYDLPLDEAAPIYNEIYTTLWAYNGHTRKYVQQAAKSWKHVDDKTIEIELWDDITLHTGKHFNADDVKASIDYTIDPKVKIRSKYRYTWVSSVEKLGPYKLRLHLQEPYALDILSIASRFYVEDSNVLGKLDKRSDYGRVSAASAGPYKLVSMDPSKGAVVERFDQLSAHLKDTNRAPIKRIIISTITDPQTQVAELLTGGLDVLHNVSQTTAADLAKQPGISVTFTPSQEFYYLQMDAIGRSGRKEFTDIRVRKAVEMAINRDAIIEHIVPGGKVAEKLSAICFSFTIACSSSTKPYDYNPSEAKRLLAEAGYANGFDMQLDAHSPAKEVAEAIAGDLREVGIKMHVQPETIAVYSKLRGEGKLAAFVGIRPTSNFPETSDILASFFRGERDYWKDDIIAAAMTKGEQTADDTARGKVLQTAIDRNNEMAYVFPISSEPIVYAHSKDVKVGENELAVHTVDISDYFWK